MKIILISGITGHLAGNLEVSLKNQGYKVIGLSRSFKKRKNYFTYEQIPIIFSKYKVDLVIHAACSHGKNGESDLEILNGNFTNYISLLEQSIKHRSKFINISTIVHKNANTYGYSKECFKQTLDSLYEMCNLSAITLRIENIYGPNEKNDQFIKMILSDLLLNKEIILSKGWQKRDFIHVDDATSAIVFVMKKFDQLKKYNQIIVGSGDYIYIREIVKKLKVISRSRSELKFGKRKTRYTKIIQRGRVPKLQNISNWNPRIKLENGLSDYEY